MQHKNTENNKQVLIFNSMIPFEGSPSFSCLEKCMLPGSLILSSRKQKSSGCCVPHILLCKSGTSSQLLYRSTNTNMYPLKCTWDELVSSKGNLSTEKQCSLSSASACLFVKLLPHESYVCYCRIIIHLCCCSLEPMSPYESKTILKTNIGRQR